MIDERARGLALAEIMGTDGAPDNAVARAEQALEAADRPGHADRAFLRFAHGAALTARYLERGLIADAREAGAAFEEALKTCPKDDPYRSTYLFELASIAFSVAVEPSEQDDALALLEQSASAVGPDHPSFAKRLSALGSARGGLAAQRRDHAAMAKALVELDRAAESAHPDDPRRAAYLHAKALTLRAAAQLTGSPRQEQSARQVALTAVRVSHPFDPRLPMYFINGLVRGGSI